MSEKKSKTEADAALTEALKQTFPASDPLAGNVVDDRPSAPVDRKAPRIDAELVRRMARRVDQKRRKPADRGSR